MEGILMKLVVKEVMEEAVVANDVYLALIDRVANLVIQIQMEIVKKLQVWQQHYVS
ncbi:hypothetical protein [Chryseobacterium sp. BLS98]|jgi:hypothetical protein|uniref:hypothetical protein n=1 Tax=Chryseobacterium sp. BLS98 TaxID=885586 RepID=UPI000B086258|nr:hypothetical protein [Chryseobacterium sp. BLS98]